MWEKWPGNFKWHKCLQERQTVVRGKQVLCNADCAKDGFRVLVKLLSICVPTTSELRPYTHWRVFFIREYFFKINKNKNRMKMRQARNILLQIATSANNLIAIQSVTVYGTVFCTPIMVASQDHYAFMSVFCGDLENRIFFIIEWIWKSRYTSVPSIVWLPVKV